MNVLTSILLICAAGLTLAWLLAAQRRLVAHLARRFLSLPRLQQALAVFAICILTVCAQKQDREIIELSNNRIIESVVASASGSVISHGGTCTVETRSVSEGRFGEAEPEGRASVCETRSGEIIELSNNRMIESAEASAFGSDGPRRAAENAEIGTAAPQAEEESLSNRNSIIRTFDYSIIDSQVSATSDTSVLRAKTTLTTNDIARSYALVETRTNGMASFEMPTNGVEVGTWGRTGAYRDVVRVELDFSHGVTCTVETRSVSEGRFGEAEPEGRASVCEARSREIIELSNNRIIESAEASASGSDDSRRAAENAEVETVAPQAELESLSNRNSIIRTFDYSIIGSISAQIELFPNGDFITRSNNVERVYKRINPDDWDDDGIENDEDEDPFVYDGENFGLHQVLPEGANSNAYCWVDVVVPQANAKVTFAGDGASNLADPSFIAKAGETHRVAILIGKTYRVTCPLPFRIAAKSSDEISENWNGANEVELCWPVEISVQSEDDVSAASAASLLKSVSLFSPVSPMLLAEASSASTTHSFSMRVSPSGLGGTFDWTKCCCAVSGSGADFSICCSTGCSCGGCSASGYYSYEGYRLPVEGGSCGCEGGDGADDPSRPDSGEPDDGPYAAGISVEFSKEAVIFEDRYESASGVWVEKQSTETILYGFVRGGPNGGTATFAFEGRGKLEGGSLRSSVVVPAGERYDFKIKYTGKLPSDRPEDIVVRGTFKENGDSDELLTEEATLTSVRVSLTAQYEAPGNARPDRHVYGVGERVKFKTEPLASEITLKVVKADSDDYATVYDTFDGEREVTGACERFYTCPATGATPDVTVTYGQTEYKPSMRVVEPQFVKTPEASGVGSFSLGDVGMGSLVTKNYIGPMTVSFQGVQVFEVPCTNAIAPSGYFATTNYSGELSHTIRAGAGWAHLIKESNYWTTDSAGRESPYPNWSEGCLKWKIPIGWRRILPGGESAVGALNCDYEIYGNENSRPLLVGNSESAYQQVFEIDANGKSSVTKFGWRLERSRWSFSGDVHSLSEEVK